MVIASLVTGSPLSSTCCGIPRSTPDPHPQTGAHGMSESLQHQHVGNSGTLSQTLPLPESITLAFLLCPARAATGIETRSHGQHKVVSQKLRREASCKSPEPWDPQTSIGESQSSNKGLVGRQKKNTRMETKVFPPLSPSLLPHSCAHESRGDCATPLCPCVTGVSPLLQPVFFHAQKTDS